MAISAKFEADYSQFLQETQKANDSLGKIEGTSQQVGAAIGDLKAGAEKLAAAFGIAFSVAAAVNFVKDTVNAASALRDLGQQTHINVEELQVLAGGMSEFGVDADTLGKGLFKLSRGIAGGDDSVATGLHLMGMSLKDVEGLQGKELFLKIESGLATLQGGLRDTAAADLFGGKLGAAMAGASEGIQGALEKWQDLNTVASTESVAAMDAFAESIARAEKNLSSIAANTIGPVAEGFNVVNDAVDKGAGKWAIAWAMMKDFAASNSVTGASTSNLAKLLDDLNQKTAANAAATKKAAGAHDEIKAAVDTRTAAEKFMAALEADASQALTVQQILDLGHLKEIGELNAKNAAGIGVNAAQFAKYTASIQDAQKAEDHLNRTTDDHAKLAAASLLALTKLEEQYTVTRIKQTGTADDVEIAGIHARYAVLAAELTKAHTLTTAISAQMAADMKQDLAGVGSAWTTIAGTSREAMQQQANAALADYDRMIASGLTFSRDVLDAQLQRYHDLQDEARGYGDTGVDAANRIKAAQAEANKTLEDAKKKADEAAQAIRAMGGSYTYDLTTNAGVEQYRKMNAGMEIQWSNASLIDFAKQGGTLQQLLQMGVIHMKAFAEGGPVTQDGPILAHAGEYVIPKGGALTGGGGRSVTFQPGAIVIHVSGDTDGRKVANQILRIVQQSGPVGSA